MPWCPTSLKEVYGELVINTISCAPTFAQVGAVQALVGPQDDVDAMVVEFKARRDLVVEGLNEINGIKCATPLGAFYAFPDISGTGLTGAEFAERLLTEADVCVLAGTAFGGVGSEHIRISYANSRENLTEALNRIEPVRRRSRSWLIPAERTVPGSSSPDGCPMRASTSSARRVTSTCGTATCRRREMSCCGASPVSTAP